MTKSKPKTRGGMVDVGAKAVTRRTARAKCEIHMSKATFRTLLKTGSPKGDVWETARVAGIMAAKSTSGIIPLCHPLAIEKVEVSFDPAADRSLVEVTAEVTARAKTGVEMEALTAASVAALTVYDMMKWSDAAMTIDRLRLVYKVGGKSGTFHRR